jgi:hypothetical protein
MPSASAPVPVRDRMQLRVTRTRLGIWKLVQRGEATAANGRPTVLYSAAVYDGE